MLHSCKVMILKKKVKNRPGFEPANSRLEGHCANHHTTAQGP